MNFYRFASIVLLFLLLPVLLLLALFLSELAAGSVSWEDARSSVLALLAALLLVVAIVLLLTCLSRATLRKAARKAAYRSGLLTEFGHEKTAKDGRTALRKLDRICDVLVRRKFPRNCVTLPFRLTRRPDPCIYSQFFLMDSGLAVTWDNPNVRILLNGVEQDTYNLQAGTQYQVRIGTLNASPYFDSVATHVEVNLLSFGIGAPTPSPITTYSVDIPAGTTDPGIVRQIDWTSPQDPGHYCIQVIVSHPDDINLSNNEGWNNTEVRAVSAGELFRRAVPVWAWRGDLPRGRDKEGQAQLLQERSDVRVVVSGYKFPAAVDVDDPDLDALFDDTPPPWPVTVTPEQFQLRAGTQESQNVEVAIQVPPNAISGTIASFNVTARAGNRPLGGVTFHLKVT